MDETATNSYSHSGTYWYGLTVNEKYDDDWKYPNNKICIACALNVYSTLSLFIGI